MARTPEGYLICYNVPISRTGMQEYLGREIGLTGEFENTLIPVYRYSDDVFNVAALASFEGKPVTDDHPFESVRPDNISRFLKGVATNIRQGKDDYSDTVVADLIIYDSILISEIESGKREISCGYDCVYEQNEKGEFCQKRIEGNHVAVVGEGRAGDRIAIKDNNVKKPEGRYKYMSRSKKKGNNSVTGALARILPMFSKDAAPEDISDAVEALVDSIAESNQDEEPPVNHPAQADNGPPPEKDDETTALLQQIASTLQNLTSRIESMEAAKVTADDPLSKLEVELSGEEGGEEAVTIPVEEMDEEAEDEETEDENVDDEEYSQDSEGVVSSPSERPENPIANADRKAVLKEIRAIKPAIAQIKDKKLQKQVSDSLAKVYRQSLGLSNNKKSNIGYAGIMNTKQMKAQQMDSKIRKQKTNDDQLGKEIAKKFNPHYKNK